MKIRKINIAVIIISFICFCVSTKLYGQDNSNLYLIISIISAWFSLSGTMMHIGALRPNAKIMRNRVYKLMYDKYNKHMWSTGFCYCLGQVMKTNEIIRTYIEPNIEKLPELIEYKPSENRDRSLYWFKCDDEGTKTRKLILEDCIKQTKPSNILEMIQLLFLY